MLLTNEYNKILQQQATAKLLAFFYNETKTTVIYPVRKMLKILFK